MKIKLSTSKKFLILAIAAILAAVAVFGFSNIQAEPTIEDLAAPYIQQMGEFKPVKPYDDKTAKTEDMVTVAWLNTTQTIFNYELWGGVEDDTNSDGKYDIADVYSKEGFEQGMLMFTALYPIFEEKGNDEYYLVSLAELNRYNGVVVDLVMAQNNDLAQLIDTDSYWYDSENFILYIKKDVLTESIEKEVFNSIRIETAMLVKDTNEMTKNIDLFAMFSEDVQDWHGLEKDVVNETRDVNVMDWCLSGLKYQLVSDEMLPYVSSENFSVYYNYSEMPRDQWSYDELTGELVIDCDVAKTRSIFVYFTKVNDVPLSSAILQYVQHQTGDTTAADTIDITDALTTSSQFIEYIQYDEKAPQVGDWQSLEFFCYVVIDEVNGFTGNRDADIKRMANGIIQYDFKSKVPKTSVATAVYEWALPTHKSGEYMTSATVSAYGAGNATQYGDIVSAMFDASKGDMSRLEDALAYAECTVFLDIGDNHAANGSIWGHKLTKLWIMSEPDASGHSDEGRYVTGVASDYLLGGMVPETSMPMFDVICAQIAAPNAEAIDKMANEYGNKEWNTDFRSNITIIAKTEERVTAGDGSVADGYIYVCLWAQSLANVNAGHTQRVLSFCRVPYKYHGTGYIEITKSGEGGEVVPGATYSVTEIKADGTRIKHPDMTTGTEPVKSGELPQGTYELKEIATPEGYLLNPTPITVTVESGKTREVTKNDGMQDDYQQCHFTMTVYDATTRYHTAKIGIPNITFQLYSTERGLLGEYTTNRNGVIEGYVKTITSDSTESYYLKQTTTVANYAMTTDPNSSMYCDRIEVYAPANDTGRNTSTTIVHYEARQEMTIHSHVQDIHIGEKSPSTLGGSEGGGSLVTLLGAQYNLRTKSSILLGYKDDGTPVTVGAGTVLTIETQQPNGSHGYNSQALSVELDNNSGKAYIYALNIKYNGSLYPIPNGTYEWVLTNASSGYYMNGDATEVDATWNASNWRDTEVDVNTPVQQERQTVNIDLLAKSYKIRTVTQTAPSGFKTTVKNKVPSLSAVLGGSYVKDTKSIYTKANALSPTSDDLAVAYKENNVKVSVEANTLAPNFIYALYNKDEIVDINSGEKMAGITSNVKMQSQPLGFYLTNAQGEIHITQLGSDEFVNPNKESNESMPKIPKCDPKTINGTSTYGHAIPNGEYYLVPYIPADNYRMENILSEDSTYSDLKWTANASNKSELSTQCAVYLWNEKQDPTIKPTVAPDAPILDKVNPDPQNPSPDDVGIFPDNTKITLEWIDNNSKNVAYRIFDSNNIDGDMFEVDDMLPTTFGFYANNDEVKDPLYKYTYHFSLFYEISQNEYNSLNDSERFVYNGTYYRKFDTNGLTQADKIDDVIKFNTTHFSGLKSRTEVNDNTTIAGMIYNTDWLNEKMREQTDGTYKLLFQIKVSYSYESKFSNTPVHVDMNRTWNGELIIKNRQLVNLD